MFGKDKEAELRALQKAQTEVLYTQKAQIVGATSVDNDYIQKTEVLRVTLDDTAVIKDFETDLLGFVWDDKNKEFIQVMEKLPDGKTKPFRKMNRKGVFWAVSQLKFYMNKSRRLTVSDRSDITKVAINSYINNLLTLIDRAEEFELDPAFRDEILDKMNDEHFFSLNRSLSGREIDSIHKQSTHAEIRHSNEADKNKGYIGKVFGGGS